MFKEVYNTHTWYRSQFFSKTPIFLYHTIAHMCATGFMHDKMLILWACERAYSFMSANVHTHIFYIVYLACHTLYDVTKQIIVLFVEISFLRFYVWIWANANEQQSTHTSYKLLYVQPILAYFLQRWFLFVMVYKSLNRRIFWQNLWRKSLCTYKIYLCLRFGNDWVFFEFAMLPWKFV